ncbi:MAG: PfkB family carbohydrate kinase [Pseudomonadales bacterium]
MTEVVSGLSGKPPWNLRIMARILICGTLAYDDIGTFAAPWSATTRNVKLDQLHRRFGGCAMNIAYNLAGLGHQAVPLVYAGDDYWGRYARHVSASGISDAGIFGIAGTPSARGIVLTGPDGVQFTAFYPGPSGLERWQQDLEELLTGPPFDAAIVAPDLPEKMSGYTLRLRGLPLVVWCPGQYAEMLTPTHIAAALEGTQLLVVNRHEWQALCAQLTAEHICDRVPRVVITDGPRPVTILPERIAVPVPEPSARAALDPTGCGDAFVAALASALLAQADAPAAVTAGVHMAARCLAFRGAQTHVPKAATARASETLKKR